MKLHRIHAAPTGGNSFELGSFRWRPEGHGTMEEKRAVAYRMAFCWNMAEGIPTEALQAGCVLQFHEAVNALLMAVERGEGLQEVVQAVRDADSGLRVDETHGRLHDCHGCLPEAAAPCPTPPRLDEGSQAQGRLF